MFFDWGPSYRILPIPANASAPAAIEPSRRVILEIPRPAPVASARGIV